MGLFIERIDGSEPGQLGEGGEGVQVGGSRGCLNVDFKIINL